MEIVYPQELLTSFKGKHLIIDTNVLIDSASKPSEYTKFFNSLKANDVAVVTSNLVRYEFIIGTENKIKLKSKEDYLTSIIDSLICPSEPTWKAIDKLIEEYGQEGKGVKYIDLVLGAMLKQYGSNICLMTRDTTDFVPSIFNLKYIVNAPHSKGIFTYGIYQYQGKS